MGRAGIMRLIWIITIGLALGACEAPQGAQDGVGFGDYDSYAEIRARRDAELAAAITPSMVVSGETPSGDPAPVIAAQPRPEPVLVAKVEPEPELESVAAAIETSAEVDPDSDNPDISDEQNFDAVSSRETIESDRDRLERNRGLYVVIEPTQLPRRPGTNVPNIVAYALATNNAIGQPLYQRGPFKSESVTARNCGRFVSPDLAQEAFLASGGPKKDGRRLDPDGDGFACKWDPAPFRNILN